MKSATSPRVLYTDNDEDAGLMLNKFLELLKIEVQTAKTVEEALKLAQIDATY